MSLQPHELSLLAVGAGLGFLVAGKAFGKAGCVRSETVGLLLVFLAVVGSGLAAFCILVAAMAMS